MMTEQTKTNIHELAESLYKKHYTTKKKQSFGENFDYVMSDLMIKILSGDTSDVEFFPARIGYAVKTMYSKNTRELLTEDMYQLEVPVDPEINDLIDQEEYDFHLLLMYSAINELSPKMKQAILDNLSGVNNFSDGNYKQALKTLRKLLGGKTTGRKRFTIGAIRSNRPKKVGKGQKSKITENGLDELRLYAKNNERMPLKDAKYFSTKFGVCNNSIYKRFKKFKESQNG